MKHFLYYYITIMNDKYNIDEICEIACLIKDGEVDNGDQRYDEIVGKYQDNTIESMGLIYREIYDIANKNREKSLLRAIHDTMRDKDLIEGIIKKHLQS